MPRLMMAALFGIEVAVAACMSTSDAKEDLATSGDPTCPALRDGGILPDGSDACAPVENRSSTNGNAEPIGTSGGSPGM